MQQKKIFGPIFEVLQSLKNRGQGQEIWGNWLLISFYYMNSILNDAP